MKKLAGFCVVGLIANFAVMAYFAAQRNLIMQLISMATLLAVLILPLVSFVFGLANYRRDKFRAFVPLLICVVGLPVSFIGAVALGGSVKQSRFQKNLTRYNEVVRHIQAGDFQPDPNNYFHIHLPPPYADLAWFARTQTNGGNLYIEFFTEGGFPVKHSGYLYVADGKIGDNTSFFQDWPIHSRINTNWFYISD